MPPIFTSRLAVDAERGWLPSRGSGPLLAKTPNGSDHGLHLKYVVCRDDFAL